MSRRFGVIVLSMLAAFLFAGCVGSQSAQPLNPEAAWYQAAADNEAARAGDRAAVERVIRRTFPAEQEKAVRVARCESGLNPWAQNGQYVGIFQLGNYHYWRFGGASGFDPVVNIDAAKGLRDASGWGPWECQ